MMHKKIAILGAGLGGLSAAIHLAAKGYKVEIFEKNSDSGGKLSQFEQDGFRFDTGPSVLTMPNVIEDLFIAANENINNFIKLKKLDLINRNFFSDNSIIDTYSDAQKFKNEISKFSHKDADSFDNYINYTKTIFEKAHKVFLYEPLHEVVKLIKENKFPNLMDFRYIDSFRTMDKSISSFFTHDKIRQIFNRYATYNGSSPYLTPATMNIIVYVELMLGAYYIDGGMYNLNVALKELFKKLDIKIHYNSDIEEIIVKDNQVDGIKVNGQIKKYDFVVSNIDVIEVFNRLIKGFDSHSNKLRKLEPSLSGYVLLLGIEGQNEKLQHHNVLFSDNYKKEFDDIFNGIIPKDPTIYISITSKSNPNHAPINSENWFILLNMPYLNDKIKWDETKYEVRDTILNKIKNFGLLDNQQIKFEKIMTPLDMYNQYRSNKGSIYGISSNNRMTAFKRPANRSRIIKNLYFAGGSTHPGGGIPLVILSGKHAADLIDYYND